MFKCALVKPIGLLCQHAAEETALNGFSRLCTCVVCACSETVCMPKCFLHCFMLVGVNVHMHWYVWLWMHKAGL